MSEQQLKEIADKADMIIANYSFTVTENGNIKILYLCDPNQACVLDKDGNMVMSSMDDARKLTESGSAKLFIKPDGDTIVQKRGTLSDKELVTIQKYIKNNYLTMFEMWSQYSKHGFFGENK